MKKRLLLVLIVGVSISPSLFASDGVGPVQRSADLELPGAGSACAARNQDKWDNIMNSNPVQKTGEAKSATVAGAAK